MYCERMVIPDFEFEKVVINRLWSYHFIFFIERMVTALRNGINNMTKKYYGLAVRLISLFSRNK